MNQIAKDEMEIIVEKYGNMVYRYACVLVKYKDIADDVFQEVFLRYVRKNPHFESDEHARAWFYVVTKNCAKNHLLSSFRRRHLPLDIEIAIEEPKDLGVYEEVLKLPRLYRNVIHLYYYEQLHIHEIAALMNRNENTIKSQLKRAREMLKKQLEEGDSNEFL